MNSARMLGFGVWRSLVARLVRDEKVEGSNPFTPTKNFKDLTFNGLSPFLYYVNFV